MLEAEIAGRNGMESHDSNDAQSRPIPEGADGADQQYVGIGSGLCWNSPFQNIAFAVELPFWLLMPATSLRVSVGDFSTVVVIDNDGLEIQHGHQFTRTHRNTVFIGGHQAATRASAPVTALPTGGLFRFTRTLLYINTFAIADALDAFFGDDGPRFQEASRYFASLAQGHLPVINKVINAYRSASVDPFANEVTAWDVPNWFVCHPPRSRSVCLYSHLVEDRYPTFRNGLEGSEDIEYFATSVDAVEQQLAKGELPGEIEMCDGWSLFHRGRFGDSIRSFVTAIEILLESQIRRLLANAGKSRGEIDSRLDATRNNFEKRLSEYCELSRRRVPGPILHFVPYINGVRLADELDRTRRLRHKIVHHGHRLDHTFAKPMLRAAETTSWLFSWLSSGDFEKRRRENSTFFFGLRTNALTFECQVREGRIVVMPLRGTSDAGNEPGEAPEEALVVNSIDRVVHDDRILLRAISPEQSGRRDVEHFVKMAFYELGMGEIEDSPYETSTRPIAERFRMTVGEHSVPIFLVDTGDKLGIVHLDDVRACLGENGGRGERWECAILVANDQNGRVWYSRDGSLATEVEKLATDSGISVVMSPALARLVLGAMKYNWSSATIVSEMLRGGLFRAQPPASRRLGDVYHFWDQRGVVGVQMTERLDVGGSAVVAIQLPQRFHQIELVEPKIDSERRLTFSVDLGRADVPIGSPVFLLDRQSSFQVEAAKARGAWEGSRVFAGGVVHPSRDSSRSH